MKQLCTILLLFTLVSCSESLPEFTDYLDREVQEISERVTSPLGDPLEVLNFTEREIYSPGTLKKNSSHLFLINFGSFSVTKVPIDRFEDTEVISFSEGSGPGELQSLQSLAVSDDKLFAGDPTQRRVVITDTDGQHLEDRSVQFSPDNLIFIDDGVLLNYNAHQQDDLYTFYHMEGDSTTGFEEIDFGFGDMMKYVGYISVYDSHIFFAAYSEPMMRKYSTDGVLHFSRANIDNFDTSDQYEERTMGDNRMVTFSEDALFSAMDVTVDGEILYVIPHHNGNSENRFIDLYSSESGDYIETYTLDLHPRQITVDEEYIFVLTRDGDDDLLLRYEKPG
ncbi:MAG: hypothetical protein JJU46_00565 [Balneolaceae bacterium]|nr:hypothetical protein [Balneolaceae bacterium]